MSKLERLALFHKLVEYAWNFYNYTWLFLEIHMQKIIFVSVMIFCVNDVSFNKIYIYIFDRSVSKRSIFIYYLNDTVSGLRH